HRLGRPRAGGCAAQHPQGSADLCADCRSGRGAEKIVSRPYSTFSARASGVVSALRSNALAVLALMTRGRSVPIADMPESEKRKTAIRRSFHLASMGLKLPAVC